MSDRIPITRTLSIREADLEEAFITAGGPGGQHVNKVATAVQLRFDLSRLPERVAARARELAGARLNKAGEVVIQASAHRTRERNRQDARDRLVELLRQAAAPPPPKRRPTRPTKGSVRRRLDGKARRGAIKKGRGRVSPD